MKKQFNLKSLLCLLLMFVGMNAWGETIEINTTNSGVTGSYADKTFTVDGVTFGFTQWMKSTNIQAKKNITNSCYNVDAIPGTINSITVVQTGTARAIKMFGGTSQKPTTAIDQPTTAATMVFDFSSGNYTYFSMTTPGNACYINTITIDYTPNGTTTTTSFPAEKYRAYMYEDFTAPTATVTGGAGLVPTYSSSNSDVATVNATTGAVTLVAPGTTTITASYVGDATYSASSASYTLEVGKSFNELQFLWMDTPASSTPMKLIFTGREVVTGVKGKNAYISDGKYGAIIYTDGHGLKMGQKLSGTLEAYYQSYYGSAEITGFNGTGLTITDGTLGEPDVMKIDMLTACNQSLYIKLEGVKYNETKKTFSLDTDTIAYYDGLGAGLTFVDGKTYDVVGIYNYRNASQIFPTAIVGKQTPTITATYETELIVGGAANVFTVTYDGDGTLAVASSKTDVATATINGNEVTVTPVAAGTATITISAPETDNYYAAEKKYTLTVKNDLVAANLPFTFNGGKADVDSNVSMKQTGLGNDYSSSPKLKFDSTGDEVVIAFNEIEFPEFNYDAEHMVMAYDIKGNPATGETWEGDFRIMVAYSASPDDWNEIGYYSKDTSQKMPTVATKHYLTLKEGACKVKFVFYEKVKGNVAIGNIAIGRGYVSYVDYQHSEDYSNLPYETFCTRYNSVAHGGAKLYDVLGVKKSGSDITGVVVEEHKGELLAGRSYIIAEKDTTDFFVVCDNNAADKCVNSNGLHGNLTLTTLDVPQGCYVLRRDGLFHKVNGANVCVWMTRAYLCDDAPEYNGAAAKVLGVDADETTGIEEFRGESLEVKEGKYLENGRVVIMRNGMKYNLNGQTIQ